MQPASFAYHRPASLEEALDLLARGEDVRALAGGHSLLPAMKLRLATPTDLVDLAGIPELTGIRVDGETVRIGAMTTYATIRKSTAVRDGCALLAEACGVVGDMQVRNRGTIGGSVAHADPAADVPTVLVALDATIELRGRDGSRSVPAREFFHGPFATALAAAELVTEIRVPLLKPGTGTSYQKHPHPASRYAVVGVAATLRAADGICEEVAVAVGGVQGTPVLAARVMERLAGRPLEEGEVALAAGDVEDHLDAPLGDAYASGEFRVHLARVLTHRALMEASARAT